MCIRMTGGGHPLIFLVGTMHSWLNGRSRITLAILWLGSLGVGASGLV